MLNKLLKGHSLNLMTYSEDFNQLSRETNFGGLPVYNKGEQLSWPTCESCEGNMQFLGKIDDGQFIYLMFMCQNDPGCCDEWDPDEGGNKVIKFIPANLQIIPTPQEGEVLRETEYGSKSVTFKDISYNKARVNWANKNNTTPRSVLGLFGGSPEWLQNDETPQCSTCKKEMSFVAQLETGPDYRTEMNFGGGGCAYLFTCRSCSGQAKFLWQC